MKVVILGAGAIGASAAYYLASRGADVTVVERYAVAGAASGKSGGFLALDWCDGSPLAPLVRRSFALHATLAGQVGGWFYRRMTAFSGRVRPPSSRAARPSDHTWLGSDVKVGGQLGTADTTAQVHPAAYTRGVMRAAEAHGAKLMIGNATGLRRERDRITGVTIEGTFLAADAVVIAMGPWSLLAAQWAPLPAVFGLKGHSLVFKVGSALPPEALFLDVEDDGESLTPEVFPRADGTAYVCAISRSVALPLEPADVLPDAGALERLKALCARISPVLAQAPVVASGACIRPISGDGLPLIGSLPGLDGVYVATAHSVWGILNAPATGEAVADLVLGTQGQIDLSPFDPARLPPLDPARLDWSGP